MLLLYLSLQQETQSQRLWTRARGKLISLWEQAPGPFMEVLIVVFLYFYFFFNPNIIFPKFIQFKVIVINSITATCDCFILKYVSILKWHIFFTLHISCLWDRECFCPRSSLSVCDSASQFVILLKHHRLSLLNLDEGFLGIWGLPSVRASFCFRT